MCDAIKCTVEFDLSLCECLSKSCRHDFHFSLFKVFVMSHENLFKHLGEKC